LSVISDANFSACVVGTQSNLQRSGTLQRSPSRERRREVIGQVSSGLKDASSYVISHGPDAAALAASSRTVSALPTSSTNGWERLMRGSSTATVPAWPRYCSPIRR
jgi:hypothetical protein